MQRAGVPEADLIRQAIEQGGADHLERIVAIVSETGSLDLVRERARAEADSACAALRAMPDNAYVDALSGLAEFAVKRGY